MSFEVGSADNQLTILGQGDEVPDTLTHYLGEYTWLDDNDIDLIFISTPQLIDSAPCIKVIILARNADFESVACQS